MNVDANFVKRLQDRDERAWQEVFTAYQHLIGRWARYWGKGQFNPRTISDVRSEAYQRLMKALKTFDFSRVDRFDGLLFRIVQCAANSEFERRFAKKRGSGKRTPVLPDGFDQPDERRGDAFEEFQRRMLREKIYRAMELLELDLDHRDFQVYKARIVRGMESQADIAVALNVSQATVSRRMHAARDAMRRRIQNLAQRHSLSPEEAQETEAALADFDDRAFDEALAAIIRQVELERRED